jgi:hypothetical protein
MSRFLEQNHFLFELREAYQNPIGNKGRRQDLIEQDERK